MNFFQSRQHVVAMLLATVCGAWSLLSCDSGDIVEPDPIIVGSGVTAQFHGSISGGASWPSNYQLVIAAFDPSSDYSLSQKQITPEQANGDSIVIALPNINAAASTVELCVVNNIRKRIATFKKFNIKSDASRRDTLRFDVGRVDASMFEVVNQDVFENICSKCHGVGDKPAAGMDLRAQHAFENVVGVPSSLRGNEVRIIPGNADDSWLMKVLTPGNENLTHYNEHPSLLTNERDRKYLRVLTDWINAGARK